MKKVTALCMALIISVVMISCSKSAPEWQEQYDTGMRYLSEMDYENAILAFNSAIKIDPKQARAYISLADVYAAQGEDIQAAITLKTGADATGSNEISEMLNDMGIDISKDNEGNVYIIELYETGMIKNQTTYNKDGVITNITEYYPNGDSKMHTSYYPDGSPDRIQYFNEGGVNIRTEGYSNGILETVWVYNEKGQWIRQESYNSDGTLSYTHDYEYDEKGNRVKDLQTTYEYYDDGEIDIRYGHTIYEYNAENRVYSSTWYIDNEINEYSIYEYSEDGSYIRRDYYADGTLSVIDEYNSDMERTKITYYKRDGSIDRIEE